MKYDPSSQVTARVIDLSKPPEYYYLDLTSTYRDYYEFRYGEFDINGVPMVGKGKYARYVPVNIAQYGFILFDMWLDSKEDNTWNVLMKLLQWFEDNAVFKKDYCFWPNPNADKKYNLPAGFVSAMTMGEVLSFYVRMNTILKSSELLEMCKKMYTYLKLNIEEGGVRRYDQNGNLWFEEYPTSEPSFVLNGFVYTYYGLLDLLRVWENPDLEEDVRNCEQTLVHNVLLYDCGYWSLYDQLKKELVMVYYQKNVHIPMMYSLYDLTGANVFIELARKWHKQLNPINVNFVKLMYRIRPRLQKIGRLVAS